MYVQSLSTNDYSVSMCAAPKDGSGRIKKLLQKILDKVPSATFEDGKKKVEWWEKSNKVIAHPAVNRLIMGGGALAFQPAIDKFNHRVDEETREVAKNRTIAKIIAGTFVGIFVARGPAYTLVNKMTQINGKSKFSKMLLPNHNKDMMKVLSTVKESLSNYKLAWSTFIALGIMVFTNFLLDAPLTKYLTNKFNANSKLLNAKKEEVNDVI
ncbi:MAG: hypothetical protein MJ231_03670 [bacterium]|nr:hypothetical protein [bacterium]